MKFLEVQIPFLPGIYRRDRTAYFVNLDFAFCFFQYIAIGGTTEPMFELIAMNGAKYSSVSQQDHLGPDSRSKNIGSVIIFHNSFLNLRYLKTISRAVLW